MGVNDYNGRDNDGVSINPSYSGCEPNCCIMAFHDGTLPTSSDYPSSDWVVSSQSPGTGTPTQTDASVNPSAAAGAVTCYAKTRA